MKKQILILTLLLLMGMGTFAQQTPHKINIGLVPPLSSNGSAAATDTNSFSLNAIAGVSAAETGLAVAGFANIVRYNADGVLVAGFMNTAGSGRATQVAGFGNFATNSSGTQVAGFMNNGGKVSGLQIAGFMNVAKNMNGTQISGFINKAKTVHGVQLSGFLNIADTADYQLGFINIAKNGEMSLAVTVDENRTALLSFRSGGKFFYGIIGTGYNLSNKKDRYAYQAGLGVHLLRAEPFRLNAELTSGGLTGFKGLDYFKSALSVYPSIRLANRVDLFAGPSVNFIQTNSAEDIARQKHYISSWGGSNGYDFRGFYIGYSAGIAIKL
jgi:hypothetical protein